MKLLNVMSKPLCRPRIVLITLDAQDTLYKFKKPIATQYVELARQHGVQSTIDEDALASAFKTSFKAMSNSFPNYGHDTLDSPKTWWVRVVNDAFEHVISKTEIPETLPGGLYDHFATAAAYDLYPDVTPFFERMRRLKRRHNSDATSMFVGLISNSDPRVKSVLDHLGLKVGTDTLDSHAEAAKDTMVTLYRPDDDLDFVTTSCAAMIEKPHREIFEHAKAMAHCLNVSRNEQRGLGALVKEEQTVASAAPEYSTLIHVGDDYKKDYLGAKNAGWKAIYLTRDGGVANHVNAVRTLTEAADIIEFTLNKTPSQSEDTPRS